MTKIVKPSQPYFQAYCDLFLLIETKMAFSNYFVDFYAAINRMEYGIIFKAILSY